jgi:hypothetical protein
VRKGRTVQYKKGVNNKVADVLSRQIHDNSACVSMTITEILPKWVEDLKESYVGDSWDEEILSKHDVDLQLDNKIKVHCGVIRKRDNMYVDSSHRWREKLIKVMYDFSFGRHSEILDTYQRVKRLFHWSGL